MKERPGPREIASTLHRELTRRFQKALDPRDAAFDPVYVKATFLDPRYRIVLSSTQVEAAKTDILREVSIITIIMCINFNYYLGTNIS